MARTKIRIEVNELQDAITQLEATRLFSSPHTLYKAVAETPWAQRLGATAVMVYLRVKEVNVDPDNPVITMRVKPARRVGPRDPNDPSVSRPATTRRAKVAGVTFAGLDVLLDVFQRRGIEVNSVEWLMASSQKSDAENRAIRLAWSDLRDRLALPKPVKKADNLSVADLVPIATRPTDVEPIVESGVVEVVEEMPDGGPVQLQTAAEVESSGEPGIAPDVATVELAVPSAQLSLPVPAVPVSSPVPIQVTAVRPVVSRPVPVRSPVPARPMPVAMVR